MQEQENCVNGVWLWPKPSNTAGVGAPLDVFAWRTPTWNGWWISIFGQMAGFPNLILKYTLNLLRDCNILLCRLLFAWKRYSSFLVLVTIVGIFFPLVTSLDLRSCSCSASLPMMFGSVVLRFIVFTIDRFLLQSRRALVLPRNKDLPPSAKIGWKS